MRKSVVKAINKASAGQPEAVPRDMKRQWHKLPWVVRNELKKKLLGEDTQQKIK